MRQFFKGVLLQFSYLDHNPVMHQAYSFLSVCFPDFLKLCNPKKLIVFFWSTGVAYPRYSL